MKTRSILFMLSCLLFLLPLAACRPEVEGVAEATPSPLAESETATPSSEPVTLYCPGGDWGYPNPFGCYPRGPGYVRMSFLFDALTWKDEEGVIPWLATDWEMSHDGLQWTFTLRPNVVFHDGEPLTAEDVAFSYLYLADHPEGFTWDCDLENLISAETLSDDEVRFVLEEPSAAFLVDTAGSVPVIPKHIWQDVDDPLKYVEPEAVIGSGPFELVEYSKEEGYYKYVANDSFFLGRPNVDNLIFVAVQDEALALQTGTTDVASFSGKEIQAVEQLQDGDYGVLEGPSFWVLQLIFNTKEAPFNDVAVRKAVAQAIDRERIVEQVTLGGATVASLGIVSPHTEWHNPDLPSYPYDPEAARAALEAAGVAGTSVEILTTSSYAREAEFVKDDLVAAGLEVTINTGDRSTVDGLLGEAQFELAINGHGGIANPSIMDSPEWPAECYENGAYDELFREQAKTMDTEARRDLVWELQSTVADELPVLTLYHPKMWVLYDPSVVDSWFYTAGGMSIGIPLPLNKLAFLDR